MNDQEIVELAGFFRLLEIEASEASEHPETFARLRRNEVDGVLIHDLYDEAVLREVVSRLERHDPPFLETSFPEEFHSWFYGRNLNLADPALAGYFEEAELFNRQLEDLFPTPDGFRSRISELLARLDGGRPFVEPPGPEEGQRYMFTTLRCHLEGGYIPPHLDNEFALRRSYTHLRTLVEPPIISFVLVIDEPDDGGALEVYDFRQETTDDFELIGHVEPDTSELASVRFRVPPGSVILIDSGRTLHRVTPVVGERPRWTACSFMALSQDHDAMYCWG